MRLIILASFAVIVCSSARAAEGSDAAAKAWVDLFAPGQSTTQPAKIEAVLSACGQDMAHRAGSVYGNVELCRMTAARLKELGDQNFKGTEFPGVGHYSVPPQEEFAKFLADKTRVAAPQSFKHFFHLMHHAEGYYLRATELAVPPMDFSKPIQVELAPGEKPDPNTGFERIKQYTASRLFKFWATVDRDKNEIAVQATGIKKLRLSLIDGLVDLSKPVTIKYWSRTWTGIIPPSARCVLEHYAATCDATRLVYNELEHS